MIMIILVTSHVTDQIQQRFVKVVIATVISMRRVLLVLSMIMCTMRRIQPSSWSTQVNHNGRMFKEAVECGSSSYSMFVFSVFSF